MLMSFAQYARHRGVSKAAVTYAIRDGRISVVTDGSGKRYIESDVADREWTQNTQHEMRRKTIVEPEAAPSPPSEEPGAAEGQVPKGVPPYAQSRALKEAFLARLAKLD